MYNPDLLLILVENFVSSLNIHYQLTIFDITRTHNSDVSTTSNLIGCYSIPVAGTNLMRKFHQTHILKIWENPELGHEEYKAHQFLTDFLEEKGFTVVRS